MQTHVAQHSGSRTQKPQKLTDNVYVGVKCNGRVLVRNETIAFFEMDALSGVACSFFEMQAEVKYPLASQDRYPNAEHRLKGWFEDTMRLMMQPIYSEYVEYAKWGVSLRKAHQLAQITPEEFQCNREFHQID